MASCSKSTYSDPTNATGGCGGVCMMNSKWRDEQDPIFINFISSFLNANSFRLNFVLIAPDLIFNCGGRSVSFVFVTNWDPSDNSSIATLFHRVNKLKEQFANLYIVVTVPTKEHNESFIRSYFKYGMQLGKPAFLPVQDIEMGFEKIVKLSLSHGVCKQSSALSRMKQERKQMVQGMDFFMKVVTSIPRIDNHDANSLKGGIGSIQAIARASKEYILEKTDLSPEKAEMVFNFFRDPKLYLSPEINSLNTS